ncbi:hypothetical protein Bhyg_10441 [Pseudolycoriella hygida]|uniref:Uncharacterized protein n=1 Tax=Pseudolycoriella hygida TaxID=35572 RepID=A0A9Q0RXD3_9DIPT|nr:hypothetical protein Bhyg_10441 [Pseudolycoriella hygida]
MILYSETYKASYWKRNLPPGTCPGPNPCPGNNPDGPNGVICLDPAQGIPAPIPPHAAAAAANALKGVGRIENRVRES